MRRYFIYLIYLVIALLAVSWQLARINSWPTGYNNFNIVLILVLIFWIIFDLRRGLIMALIVGVIMDFLSFELFGAYTISLLVTVYVVDLLSVNWLTNRSIYSLWALSLLGVGAYNFCLYFLFYLGKVTVERSFFLFNGSFWLGFFWELVWTAGIIFCLLLFGGHKISKLRPVFLERS